MRFVAAVYVALSGSATNFGTPEKVLYAGYYRFITNEKDTCRSLHMFLQLILSNRPPIWPGRDKRFSAIELASFTGCR